MRIKSALILCTILALSVSTAYPAPVGNIATPAMLKSAFISKDEDKQPVGITAGAEADIIYDREVKDQIGKTELSFYSGKIGVVFFDRATVYGLLGTGSLKEEFHEKGEDIKFESQSTFAWGGGVTIILFETLLYDLDNSKIRLGVDGRYRSTVLDVGSIKVGEINYGSLPRSEVTNTEMNYADWQAAAAVSWQWKRFSPYFGLKYSDAIGTLRADVNEVEYQEDIECRNRIGIFFGADIVLPDPISGTDAALLNVEYRLLDEKAFSAGLTIRF